MPDEDRVHALFTSLREATQPAPPRDEPEAAPELPGADDADDPATAAETTEPPAAPQTEPADAELSGDGLLRAARDEMLDDLVTGVLRVAKRLLQDQQNELLDATRRARGRIDGTRLVPDPDTTRRAWALVLTPAVGEAYAAGRRLAGRKPRGTTSPQRLVDELSGEAGAPLHDRLMATIEAVVAEGPYESTNELRRVLATAIGARYREFRQRDLEPLLGDLLAAAYARGAYDGAPSGAQLRWVPAAIGQCPDADDNALEPTVKGRAFPTGQHCPPAHPGCRCVVVPTDA